MKKIACLFFVFLISQSNYCQLSYAKKNVKKLSSKKMNGSGYVKDGHKKAALYIAKEFKKHNLLSFNDQYFQTFYTSVNTQPGKTSLTLNKNKLKPGTDFLINPSSPSIQGEFKTTYLSIEDIFNNKILLKKLDSSANKVLLLDLQKSNKISKDNKKKLNDIVNYLIYSPNIKCKATIIFKNEKLTWTGSTQENTKASFTVNKPIDAQTITTINTNCESLFLEKEETQNIIGSIKGYSKLDSTIIISAHYDHLGMMGKKTIFPGANDNASGVALLLELAKHYSQKNNQPKYDIIFIAFGGEEIGLLGSKFYTENPVSPLKNIKFMLNFDLAGTGDDGIKVVNATEFMSEFDKLIHINKNNSLLPSVKPRGPACNSDHCFFYNNGVPCFYIYTLGGIKAYHDIHDKYETLPFTAFENYSKLLKLYIDAF